MRWSFHRYLGRYVGSAQTVSGASPRHPAARPRAAAHPSFIIASTGGSTDGDRSRLRTLRGTDLRLLRHAHRLGGRHPRRPAACPRRARRRSHRRRAARGVRRARGGRRERPVPPLPRRSSAAACARSPPTTASSPTSPRSRPSPIRSGTGRLSPIRSLPCARLHERFRLGVITNCDDDLFARSAARLDTDFDWVVTAQQARELQAQRSATSRSPSSASGCRANDPACRPEPVPRPRAGQAARPCDRLDRSPARPAGIGSDAAGRGNAGRDLPGHGLLRRGRDRGLTLAHAGTAKVRGRASGCSWRRGSPRPDRAPPSAAACRPRTGRAGPS